MEILLHVLFWLAAVYTLLLARVWMLFTLDPTACLSADTLLDQWDVWCWVRYALYEDNHYEEVEDVEIVLSSFLFVPVMELMLLCVNLRCWADDVRRDGFMGLGSGRGW